MCTVMANGTSLGAPECKPHHNIYLKTVYTCIHQDVLKPQYIDQPLTTTTVSTTTTTSTTTTSTTTSTTARPLTLTLFPPQNNDYQQMKPAETMLDDKVFNAEDSQVKKKIKFQIFEPRIFWTLPW